MANPAPTITNINAFDATQGTTINFNVIGGTDIIRSNKIYIYDLETSDLICTHLYVSTQFIHELPANTDVSIEYADGKSSTDFRNNKQYYATIQTYTDTEGTTGASGASVAKVFYCLDQLTVTMGAINPSIDTTSCNIVATYNTNAPAGVNNVASQYVFNLYTSNGVLTQTSGIIVGAGIEQDTDTYQISYNFAGLNVGISYYAVVTISTVQGMTATGTTTTFLVDPTVPTLSSAVATNDACNGVIDIVVYADDSYEPDITTVLVKRREANTSNAQWLTLCSIPIERADDMDFIFTDFLNQYGKTYEYAVVPVIQQNQGGVWVSIEGGYVTSDPVLSTFDGVFITDGKSSQRLKAGVGYNSGSYIQSTGTIDTIGSKYPIVVTNSNLGYYSGSLFAQIVTSDFYTIGDRDIYDRLDMVQQRQILQEFLTNKHPKIIKDWNGNIWLVMFVDNVSFNFDNNYGMGMATISGSFVEIGDVNNYNDLLNTNMISGVNIVQKLYAYLLNLDGDNLCDENGDQLVVQTYDTKQLYASLLDLYGDNLCDDNGNPLIAQIREAIGGGE